VSHAQGPLKKEKIHAPEDGGGKTTQKKNADYIKVNNTKPLRPLRLCEKLR
jgi:hypothetical protein